MPSLALAAIGRDRPGIVAAVARVLYDRGCNVEDSSMTLLRGNFAIMLVLDAPQDLSASALEDALRAACEPMGLTLTVLEIDETGAVPSPTHVLTVYGADRPGILFRTTELLAEAGVNITDLNSRLVGAEEPVYALILELEVPSDLDVSALKGSLDELATEIGVDAVLNEHDVEVL